MRNAYEWYANLIKPTCAPPNYLFGPVWTFLYTIIFASFGYVFYLYFTKRVPFIVILPFILNLGFNFVFTPIQFGLKSNVLAALDITLVWITLVWAIVAIYPYVRWVSYVSIPYLLWVTFASILQFTITYLNG